MNFKDLNIDRSYISYGEKNISNSLIIPALKLSKNYYRSVGFFSSGVLNLILDGVVKLSRNKGKIRLITSPKLSEDDIEAIKLGYSEREDIIINNVSHRFREELENLGDEKLALLAQLIAYDVLDIKIACTNDGFYHDKFGLLEDFNGNIIAFYGSANSSVGGYKNNYEKVRVSCSWKFGEEEQVQDEIEEFRLLWNNKNQFVKTYEFKETANANIFEVISKRKVVKTPIKLYDYQKEAINAWIKNNYRGFYAMATGTGKTWTAIFSIKELLKKEKVLSVIAMPYKHLISQWYDDIINVFPEARIIMVSSENKGWESRLSEEIIRNEFDDSKLVIVLTTIASFSLPRFKNTIFGSKRSKLLIIDEAHRFTKKPEYVSETYSYMLGLSATPYNGKDKSKGDELVNFFGGIVYSLPIEVALERNFLVPYLYKPIYVYASEEDESKFKLETRRMASCYKNKKLVNQEKYVKAYRARLRAISMADEKIISIKKIISNVEEKDHVVVYCGDGKLFFNDQTNEKRHIQFVKQILTDLGYKTAQFTAAEKMDRRKEIVDTFNSQEITALSAIRCLDEGINIPSIKSALILSSNDDYREFVQRRGRILRKHPNKESAKIYDVVVLPSSDTKGMAIIELRRFYEYGRFAINSNDLLSKLDKLLDYYDLNLNEIMFFNESIDEDGDIDE